MGSIVERGQSCTSLQTRAERVPLLKARTAASTCNHKPDAIAVEDAWASHQSGQEPLLGVLRLSTYFSSSLNLFLKNQINPAVLVL